MSFNPIEGGIAYSLLPDIQTFCAMVVHSQNTLHFFLILGCFFSTVIIFTDQVVCILCVGDRAGLKGMFLPSM